MWHKKKRVNQGEYIISDCYGHLLYLNSIMEFDYTNAFELSPLSTKDKIFAGFQNWTRKVKIVLNESS